MTWYESGGETSQEIKKVIQLFLRERKGERSINAREVLIDCLLIHPDWGSTPGLVIVGVQSGNHRCQQMKDEPTTQVMCLDWESNPQSFGYQTILQPLSHPSPGGLFIIELFLLGKLPLSNSVISSSKAVILKMNSSISITQEYVINSNSRVQSHPTESETLRWSIAVCV